MEESLDLFKIVKDAYEIHDIDLKTYSPLTLAYIGDAVYDMVIRTRLVTVANTQVNKLHKRASKLVNAGAQATMITALLEDLTEEELQVYKRGRNAQAVTKAKNASMKDYRTATGFEALIGYLYLNQETERMLELIDKGLHLAELLEEN
jgi:ribonuclease-3 family protein